MNINIPVWLCIFMICTFLLNLVADVIKIILQKKLEKLKQELEKLKQKTYKTIRGDK